MKNKIISSFALILIVLITECGDKPEMKGVFTFEQKVFGQTEEGKTVYLYTFGNSKGMEISIMNYGGSIVKLKVPDRDGNIDDIVLGYDKFTGYLENNPYFGGIIGRFANRIAKGKFILDRKEYKLAVNNGPNHLHGGLVGFDRVIWNAEKFENDTSAGLIFTYLSKDGEEGYPGNLNLEVKYFITLDNEMFIEYKATTDKRTIINLTNHSYFNLGGGKVKDILGHQLMINADYYTPVDETLIPTGEIAPVENTPMDFRKITPIGARINDDFEQLKFGGGYDHNWVLNKSNSKYSLAIKLFEPVTGRVLEIFTSEPGVQFYSGNFLDGTITGKYNRVYTYRSALVLETQHFPDSPNQPDFQSVVLNPGEEYYHKVCYKFSVE